MESVTLLSIGSHDCSNNVLNAFRHHGIGHGRTQDAQRFTRQCSTPSGIMESVTEKRVLFACYLL